MTSPLPRECSTTELLEHYNASAFPHREPHGGQREIRTPEGVRQLIYSQPPLATWVSAPIIPCVRLAACTSVEPTMGLEPATGGLQNRCSAN